MCGVIANDLQFLLNCLSYVDFMNSVFYFQAQLDKNSWGLDFRFLLNLGRERIFSLGQFPRAIPPGQFPRHSIWAEFYAFLVYFKMDLSKYTCVYSILYKYLCVAPLSAQTDQRRPTRALGPWIKKGLQKRSQIKSERFFVGLQEDDSMFQISHVIHGAIANRVVCG